MALDQVERQCISPQALDERSVTKENVTDQHGSAINSIFNRMLQVRYKKRPVPQAFSGGGSFFFN